MFNQGCVKSSDKKVMTRADLCEKLRQLIYIGALMKTHQMLSM